MAKQCRAGSAQCQNLADYAERHSAKCRDAILGLGQGKGHSSAPMFFW
jgi:hypothetical protein